MPESLHTKLYFLAIIFLLGIMSASCGGKQEETTMEEGENQPSPRLVALEYLLQNQLDKAEEAYREVVKDEPNVSMNYANLGLVYLRKGDFSEAKKQLNKALEIEPENPEIKLILAETFRQNDEQEKAIEVLKSIIEIDPQNAKAFFMLANLHSEESDNATSSKQKLYLKKVLDLQPANVVPRLQLIEILADENKTDSCIAQLEELKKTSPEFPDQAENEYQNIISLLQQEKTKEAQLPIRQFHKTMKVTPAYTNGLDEIEGPEGKLTGYPVFVTDQYRSNVIGQGESLIDVMQLKDATSFTGLNPENQTNADFSLIEVSDYDGDGDIDVYYSYKDPNSPTSEYYLFNNSMGSFTDIKVAAGISHEANELAASFTDYDNDGNIDLIISTTEGFILYKNNGNSTFTNVTEEATLNSKYGANAMLFADLDQDGDLDLYAASEKENKLFRYNGDGTFTENASEKMGLKGENLVTKDVAFADMDNDGDPDLLTANENTGLQLLTNHRHASFENITESLNINSKGSFNSLAIGDYNNDGLLDVFAAGQNGKYALYKNQEENSITIDEENNDVFESIQGTDVHDVSFLDFDNDGYLDLLIAGTPENDLERGVFLFHNDSINGFRDVSNLIPDNIKQAFGIEIADFNVDGDMDIFLATKDGIRLVRNENGNLHYYIDVQLVGLSYGSSKNNRFGIGAQIALRSGDLYQMKTVTEPVVHFGLGKRNSVDVMRIIWPNGVPQNINNPKSKEDLVEEQTLKGSCPFLFTWNGEEYEFQKDMMWRSALGMPVAIDGKDTIYSFSDISTEYLKISGEKLKPKDGLYSIKISEELWEAVYFDKASLIAVDHPASVDFYVDERFVLPPFPDGELFQVAEKHLPVSAKDDKGIDQMKKINAYDFDYVSGFQSDKYQGITEKHDLILDLGEKAHSDSLYLFLRGWVFPTDASINVALTQTDKYKVQPPSLQVINENGEWETVIDYLGYPMGKDKMVIADLTGKFPTEDRRVKISTNMQIYWDHIFFSTSNVISPVKKHNLKIVNANLDFRGYSVTYRKGGRFGPHWFDYDNFTTGQKWRDLTGNYTRYGDVKPLLTEGDDKYIIANSGDVITINFDAKGLPELPEGWKRDFLIYSEGWVKDGDLNTAHGQKVTPLPFRGMEKYPYGDDVAFPSDSEHRKYQKEYNTRKVTTDEFKNALKPEL